MTFSNYFINTIQHYHNWYSFQEECTLWWGPLRIATKRPIRVLYPMDGNNRIEWSKNGEAVQYSEIEAYDRFCTSLR